MSIVKMKAVTVAGKLGKFEYLVEKYLYNRDIHFENALSLMSEREGLHSFKETNEYDVIARNITSILKLANTENFISEQAENSTTIEEMREYIGSINKKIDDEKALDDDLNKQMEQNKAAMTELEPMLELNIDLESITKLEFIKYRFGHLPNESYRTLNDYLGDVETFFVKTSQTGTDVWGFYFAPLLEQKRIDTIFSSLYFEETEIPETYKGVPKRIYEELKEKNAELQKSIEENSAEISRLIESSKMTLFKMLNLAKKRQGFAEIRKKAMHSEMFFFVTGWMDEKSALKLERDINKSDDEIICYLEEPEAIEDIAPPTKLKNNAVFKPFEMFVKMYGLPNYREIDPTPILAVTYILFFGIMFGDVGQSFILSLAGFILYKVKKWDLGGIVGFVGISGMIFGFLYGSVFGNEKIIPMLFHTWNLNPMEEIGVMLGGTIAMGVVIIIFGIILNMINSVRDGHIGKCLVNHNGLAGIVFYITLFILVGNIILNFGIPNIIPIAVLILAVLVMYLEEPLAKLIEGEKDWMPSNGMFFVESFFELFEVLLSFFSNTISFLRIGAFAIVHVGMMQVVAVLAASGGVGGVIVKILGNLLVMGLEGLIVGIQVLRLEYYEMFSRYFSGQGKEFISQQVK